MDALKTIFITEYLRRLEARRSDNDDDVAEQLAKDLFDAQEAWTISEETVRGTKQQGWLPGR